MACFCRGGPDCCMERGRYTYTPYTTPAGPVQHQPPPHGGYERIVQLLNLLSGRLAQIETELIRQAAGK